MRPANAFPVRLQRRVLLVLALLLLAGCAGLEPAPDPAAPAALELRARIAYRYAGQGGSATIAWRHADSFDQLLVTGPLGQGLASLDRRDTRWLLTTMEGRQFRADDPESLTESALGWRLPLGGLVDWVQGRPGTGSGREAQVERDGEGRITRILQDGWRVEYLAWQADHPSRINLQRAAAP